MSILDTLVAPLVAPLMLIGTMLPTGQSTVYATETHVVNSEVKAVVRLTPEEIRKQKWKNQTSRSRSLASKTGTAKGNRDFAKHFISIKYKWNYKQFRCLDRIWTQESHWNHRSDNPDSSAYGIPQALPGNKMSSVGKDWKSNPVTQIKWGAKYIKVRYGSPCEAWKFKQRTGWY